MRTIVFILTAIVTVTFAACDKGDIEIRKLNRGEGIWTIESVYYEEYDSAGANVIGSSTISNPGEFVFFRNTTLNGLFDEHFVVANMTDTSGIVTAYPGGVYYDDNRVKITCDHSLVDGVWTVEENGRRKQEWTLFSVRGDGSLETKATMNISKK